MGCSRDMEYADLTNGDHLTDKMEVALYMFGVLMLNEVGGEVHDTNGVTVDNSAPRR